MSTASSPSSAPLLPVSDLIQQLSAAAAARHTGPTKGKAKAKGKGASSSSSSSSSSSTTSPLSEAEADAAQALSDELLALQSIYALEGLSLDTGGDEAGEGGEAETLRVVYIQPRRGEQGEAAEEGRKRAQWTSGCKIRLELRLPVELGVASRAGSGPGSQGASGSGSGSPPRTTRLSLLLPPHYPASSSPPQLQLLDRFIGAHKVDTALFSAVLRTFLGAGGSAGQAAAPAPAPAPAPVQVQWETGEVALFEGCESVKEGVEAWYAACEARVREERRRGAEERAGGGTTRPSSPPTTPPPPPPTMRTGPPTPPLPPAAAAALASARRKHWTSTPALTERKSTFVGHAVRLDSPAEVPLLLEALLERYPRMSKATHPLVRAWVCVEEAGDKAPVTHRDCDDDGESAAGGRLAHLLEVLHIQNALVVVTRWYGGIHLGADRFKLINRVAREALDLAGLIPQA